MASVVVNLIGSRFTPGKRAWTARQSGWFSLSLLPSLSLCLSSPSISVLATSVKKVETRGFRRQCRLQLSRPSPSHPQTPPPPTPTKVEAKCFIQLLILFNFATWLSLHLAFLFCPFFAVLFSSSQRGPTDEENHVDLTQLYFSAKLNQGSESEIGPISWAEDSPPPPCVYWI